MSVKCYTNHKEAETMRDVKDPEVRRAEIMDAALQLFAQKGYLKTRTQDIIDKVGISRGLLYYHFKDKEDILYCLIEKNSEPLLRRLEKISYQADLPVKEKIKSFMEATLISDEQITQENLVLQETVNLERNRYVLDRFYHRLTEQMTVFFAHILEEGQAARDFQLDYPQQTASFLMTAYVFVSNDAKMTSKSANLQDYLSSFQAILEKTLGLDGLIF
ncbi:TetR/AcrR family transcriptional regulator [Streptococcus panodentis]|nr:TetR/AcrR family transcriptional regulator [Streptococcus panodentis]